MMGNFSSYEVFNQINYRQSVCPSKNNKAELIMIHCLDNQQRLDTQPSLIVSRLDLITPECSLNRLFEIAKEEHLKKQKK